MTVLVRQSEGVTFLDMEGELRNGASLRSAVTAELREGRRAFVLNLARVPYIDPDEGVWEMVAARLEISGYNGEMVLLHLTLPSDNLVAIADQIKVFRIFEDERYAKECFRHVLT